MNKEDIQHYLENTPLREALTDFERAKVADLIKHPGLPLVLGLLLAERQGFLIQLQNVTVDGMAGAQRLGVLQGQATGVDRIRHILLECVSVPTDS
jgi:hypothetical protein